MSLSNGNSLWLLIPKLFVLSHSPSTAPLLFAFSWVKKLRGKEDEIQQWSHMWQATKQANIRQANIRQANKAGSRNWRRPTLSIWRPHVDRTTGRKSVKHEWGSITVSIERFYGARWKCVFPLNTHAPGEESSRWTLQGEGYWPITFWGLSSDGK